MVSSSVIKSCLQKDSKAYKDLYNASIPYVYSVVKRYLTNIEDRKDIVQEIFAKVFLKLGSFDSNRGEFKTWIRKIAVNECLMHLRKSSNLKIYKIDSNLENTLTEDINVLDQLTRNDIIILLNKMPERYRMVFIAYIIDDYSHKEIGEILGITKDTSRSQLSRAKKWIMANIIKDNKNNAYGLF